ncbi:MAG: metallophosphoesterase [Methanobacteriota archaeon]
MEPIHGRPALTFEHDGGKYLVAADLHIGIEHEISSRGVQVPSQTMAMASLLVSMGEAVGATKLVIAGDAKHNLPRMSDQERYEVPRFFRTLEMQFERVDLARGNHDGGLDYLAPEWAKIHPASGFTIGDFGFCHGHSWPSETVFASKTLFVAHAHPTALFVDGIGRRATEKCWLRGKAGKNDRYEDMPKGFVLLPALHPYCGGTPVNERGRDILGPLFKGGILDTSSADIYLMDGTRLGKWKDNMVEPRKTRARR